MRPFGDTNTVLRMGWGLYTTPWPGSIGLQATGGPWQSDEDFILESESVPTITFPNPFLATSDFSGIQSIAGVSRVFPGERTQQWSFSLGQQIWNTAIDIGYIGTKAQNIPFTDDLNLLRPSTIPFDAARRPYPRYNSAELTQAGGSSIYHGLTIQADRRLSRGLWYNVNYTWAKALTDVELGGFGARPQQNQYQRFLERADEPRHRRQQLRFSYGYQLPFGRGKKFVNDAHPVVNGLLGGWQVAGITTMLTGQRLSPEFSGVDPANTNEFGGRPDRVGDGNFDSGDMRDSIKARMPIFDRNAFGEPAAGRGFYGNSARYILTGPGEVVWNIVGSKNFSSGGNAHGCSSAASCLMPSTGRISATRIPTSTAAVSVWSLAPDSASRNAAWLAARLLTRLLRVLFLLLVAVVSLARAQESPRRHSAQERFTLFEENLKRRAGEIANRHLSEIKTLDDWKRERPRRKQQMLSMLGLDPLPQKTPLRARTTGTLDRGGYRVEKIVFESMPGLYVTGNLYLPSKIEGRLPTVLVSVRPLSEPLGIEGRLSASRNLVCPPRVCCLSHRHHRVRRALRHSPWHP